MDSYSDFAYVYDMFMDNVPYSEWAKRIRKLLERYDERIIPEDSALKAEASLLVDLGCGTGTLTRLLKEYGYDCIGIDSSEQMLEVALGHEDGKADEDRILYLNQDMREFELYSTAGAFVCVCDSLNYLTDPADVLKTFHLVNNYLYPKGLFVFDFNTVRYYRDELGNTVIAENRPEASFIWENYYDDEDHINEYDLTIYRRVDTGSANNGEGNEDGPRALYERFEETHVQRGYYPEEIFKLIEESGLKLVKAFDSDTEGEVTDGSLRVCVVARESGKEDIH